MARISTYVTDPIVTSNDKWIGTDFSGGITKNFTPQNLADFFNESGVLGVVNQINFKYYKTFIGERPVGSITTNTQEPAFSSLTTIKVSEKNSGLKYIVDVLNTFIGETIMLSDTSNPNKFGIYKLTNVEEDLSDSGFYNLSLQLNESNGNLEDSHVYGLTPVVDSLNIDKTYIHNQGLSSNEWEITHGLNKYPSISIVDSGYNVVVGEVEYIDLNRVTLRFSASFSGKAYLN
ncbi:hypothetical protein [Flavobacterium sp.]|uniref:hypothetical protein n=1 Tax=Flavobacterium sp. TaxID=239 RepID=UPI0025CFDAB4|nr:hypothetical protein [Flavobacterium sp.]